MIKQQPPQEVTLFISNPLRRQMIENQYRSRPGSRLLSLAALQRCFDRFLKEAAQSRSLSIALVRITKSG